MDKVTQMIKQLEDKFYGTDPEVRRNRMLGTIDMGIETVCNLYEAGFAEDARQRAELMRSHVQHLRTNTKEEPT